MSFVNEIDDIREKTENVQQRTRELQERSNNSYYSSDSLSKVTQELRIKVEGFGSKAFQKGEIRSLKKEVARLENSLSGCSPKRKDEKRRIIVKLNSLSKRLHGLTSTSQGIQSATKAVQQAELTLYKRKMETLKIPEKVKNLLLTSPRAVQFLPITRLICAEYTWKWEEVLNSEGFFAFLQLYNPEDFHRLAALLDNSNWKILCALSLPKERIKQIFDPRILSILEGMKEPYDVALFFPESGAYQVLLDLPKLEKFFKTKEKVFSFLVSSLVSIYEVNPDLCLKMINATSLYEAGQLCGNKGFPAKELVKLNPSDMISLCDYLILADMREVSYLSYCFKEGGIGHPVVALAIRGGSRSVRPIEMLRRFEVTTSNEPLYIWMLDSTRTMDEVDLGYKCAQMLYNKRYGDLVIPIMSALLSGEESPLLTLFKADCLELCKEWLKIGSHLEHFLPPHPSAADIETLVVYYHNVSQPDPQRIEEFLSGIDEQILLLEAWPQGPVSPLLGQYVASGIAQLLITGRGLINFPLIPQLLERLKSKFAAFPAHHTVLKHILSQLEHLLKAPQLRDVFFSYSNGKSENAAAVLTAFLTPVRQGAVGTCAASAVIISMINNDSILYLHLLFSIFYASLNERYPTPTLVSVNLNELKGVSLPIDENGRFLISKKAVWEIPAIRAAYAALEIDPQDFEALTKATLSSLSPLADSVKMDTFLLALQAVHAGVQTGFLEEGLKRAYTTHPAIQAFKKALAAFHSYFENPLNAQVIGKILTEQNRTQSLLHQGMIRELIETVNKKTGEKDAQKTLITRFFTAHPELNAEIRKCEMIFQKIVEREIRSHWSWVWNAELPRIAAANDEDIPDIKKTPGGYSLYHRKYGPLDSEEAFRRYIPAIIEDWNQTFLDKLSPGTRAKLVANGWNQFISQLGLFLIRGQSIKAFETAIQPGIGRSGVDRFLPWRLPPGGSYADTVKRAYKVSQSSFIRELQSVEEIYETYKQLLDNLPLAIKQKAQMHGRTLKIPLERPSHGLNLFLYPETPPLPPMPSIILSTEEQERLLQKLNQIEGTKYRWKHELAPKPIHEVRLALIGLFSEEYYLQGASGKVVNYFADDQDHHIGETIETLMAYETYELVPHWRDHLRERIEMACHLTEEQKNSQEYQDAVVELALQMPKTVKQLVDLPVIDKMKKNLTPEQQSLLIVALVNELSCLPKTWYNASAPAFDLNWEKDMHGYWVQNPIKNTLELQERSLDGRWMAVSDPKAIFGKWLFPDMRMIYDFLAPQDLFYIGLDPYNTQWEARGCKLVEAADLMFRKTDGLNIPISLVEAIKALIKLQQTSSRITEDEHAASDRIQDLLEEINEKVSAQKRESTSSAAETPSGQSIDFNWQRYEEVLPCIAQFMHELFEFLRLGTVDAIIPDETKKQIDETITPFKTLHETVLKNFQEALAARPEDPMLLNQTVPINLRKMISEMDSFLDFIKRW